MAEIRKLPKLPTKRWIVTIEIADSPAEGEEYLDRIDIEDMIKEALTPGRIRYSGVEVELIEAVEE